MVDYLLFIFELCLFEILMRTLLSKRYGTIEKHEVKEVKFTFKYVYFSSDITY